MSKFTPSAYQQAIRDHIANPNNGNLIVNAVAGSGKSTTIAWAMKETAGKVVYLAFNKSIAEEFQPKLPSWAMAKTFHALGRRVLMAGRRYGEVTIDSRKNYKLMDRLGLSHKKSRMYGGFVTKLVSIAKQAGFLALTDDPGAEAWFGIIDHHAMVLRDRDADPAEAVAIARQVLRMAADEEDLIDFDDMLWQPFVLGKRWDTYDWVFVDEAQDTNKLQAEIVRELTLRGGRAVFVGDKRQAIYGFRGADSGAMDRIAQEFKCDSLPLSVSYRCAKDVVAAAKEFAPEIEAFEGSPDGIVEDLGLEWTTDHIRPADAVLCRNVAPLLALAYRHIAEGKGVQVLGRDIGEGLSRLVDRIAGTTVRGIDAFVRKLEGWRDREVAKALSENRDDVIDRVTDQFECLSIIAENVPEDTRTVAAMKRSIAALFDQKTGPVPTLCTIHKSKGLEWDRVFILDPHRMPSPWAKRDWQRVQEDNLHYVAITRARGSLAYITLSEKQSAAAK